MGEGVNEKEASRGDHQEKRVHDVTSRILRSSTEGKKATKNGSSSIRPGRGGDLICEGVKVDIRISCGTT